MSLTSLHTRTKGFQDLYRANPVNRTAEIEKREKEQWSETKKLIDEGHKNFWKQRTQGKPPRVSKTRFGDFDIL